MTLEHGNPGEPEPQGDIRPVRVADLYCGEGATTRAAFSAGMEVVYAYDQESHRREAYFKNTGLSADGVIGPANMLNSPEFDLMVVNLSAAISLSGTALTQAFALVRERQPKAVVVVGPAPTPFGDVLVLSDKSRDLEGIGYCLTLRLKVSDDFTDSPRSWRSVIIATKRRAVFVWPDEVGDEGFRRGRSRSGKGQPSPLLVALMAAMDKVLRGPVVVEIRRPKPVAE